MSPLSSVSHVLQAVWPGEFGVPKPWYFPVTVSYWCGREAGEVAGEELEMAGRGQYSEQEPSHLPLGMA